MTPVWLLPVVTLIVASSSGGVLARALQDVSPSHALITITTSVFLVTIGLSLALMLITIYLLRLIIHGLPPTPLIVSTFINLGPLGQSGYSILLIGQSFKWMSHHREIDTFGASGDIINVICICIAFILWSLATMWMIFALLSIGEVSLIRRDSIPFKVSFWGLIFPNVRGIFSLFRICRPQISQKQGVYANLTIELYRALDSQFFRVFGALYAAFTLILWCGVFIRTVMLLKGGEIFEAPCLEGYSQVRSESQSTSRGRSMTVSRSR